MAIRRYELYHQESNDQWAVLGIENNKLVFQQINIANAGLALDVVKNNTATIPGVPFKATISVTTDES